MAVLDLNNARESNPIAAEFQTWALDNVVVPVARAYGVEDEYAYLVPSINAFPGGACLWLCSALPHTHKGMHYLRAAAGAVGQRGWVFERQAL